MIEHELLKDSEKRIEEHRTAEAEVTVTGPDGKPLAGAEIDLRLVRHEFKLGANAFRLHGIENAGLQRAYDERFGALLNYATLPFYWGAYEPEPDRPNEAKLDAMAAWCAERGVIAKGHPLAWHEVYPKWAEALEDDEVMRRLEARVRNITERFRGRIDTWDVVNEATVSHRYENAVGRKVKAEGAAAFVDRALEWAHEGNPRAVLLYNDFNVSDDFEALVAELVRARAHCHTVGIQSHMHKGMWPLGQAWDTCEHYARFGMPLHFTELTILSGCPKAEDDNEWHKRRDDWPSTPEGEARQLEYGSALYTLLFSHPAVEAITCWDFSDNGAWQGAPAGLVRADMSPKPLYDWLAEAFGKRWTTRARVTTDGQGRARVRCFFGEHEMMVRTSSGENLKARFTFGLRGVRKLVVTAG
ncbi:MAG: endo-1,4-beta-xylanase [Planctomycetota bacterium]|jgi:GH35 family endo-1,4-beta-xylanase